MDDAREYIFPWAELLEASYLTLAIPPDIFWDMTPREWAILARIKAEREGQIMIGETNTLGMYALLTKLRSAR